MAAPAKAPRPLAGWVKSRIAWVQSLKPVRVFQHYSRLRGPILASGLAFQGLFAVFAGLWVAFSIAGLVISGNTVAQDAIVTALNNAIPGLIDQGDGSGAIKASTLLSAGVFGWTGAIALVGLLYSALGWLGSARDAVRTMFELPSPAANFAALKARDLALGGGLGVVLLVSAVLSVAGTSATGFLLGLVDIPAKSVLLTWLFLHTRGSVLLAILFHAATNLFDVSPNVVGGHGLMLPLLAAAAKWLLVLLVILVAGPGLRGRSSP